MAGNRGSFTAKNARVIKLKAATYDAADDTVTLVPRKVFALTKKVQLRVDGVPPSGLEDSLGRLIDGDRQRPGREQCGRRPLPQRREHCRAGVRVHRRPSGVTPVVIDALLELNALAQVTPSGRGGRDRR